MINRLIITLFIIISTSGVAWETELNSLKLPSIDYTERKIVNLKPIEVVDYEAFFNREKQFHNTNHGTWSTINYNNLDDLHIEIQTSSSLRGYPDKNLFDGQINTAWVEGATDDGIGEWIGFQVIGSIDTITSTPFTIEKIAIVSGYLKSKTTWISNNRLKQAKLIVMTPLMPDSFLDKYQIYRLHFLDKEGIHVFDLNDKAPSNIMIKNIWLVIEDVYKGTKYSDTCISEIIISDGFIP